MTQVVAALIWREDRFLICQRPAHKARGGLWEFVGGKTEPGETPQQALIRECREELDVQISVDELFMELVHTYPDLTVQLLLFNAEIRAGEPKLLEHQNIQWITTAQIDDYDFCPADEEILSVLKKLTSRLQAKLYSLRESTYRDFHSRLMPTVPRERVLGVRVPLLHDMAKTMSCHEKEKHLQTLPHAFYEEDMLHSVLINKIREYDAACDALEAFLPYVDNWAVCDTLNPLPFAKRPEPLLKQVQKWLASSHTYTVRFGISVLMKHYLKEGFSPEQLAWVGSLRTDDYYIQMMIAWYFATALVFQYDHAITWLEQKRLSVWVHNKTIRKAVESFRICADTRSYLKTLKRRREEDDFENLS